MTAVPPTSVDTSASVSPHASPGGTTRGITDPFLVLVDVAERSDDHKSPFDYSYWSDWFSHLATFENKSHREKIVSEYWTTSYNEGFGFETSQSRQFWILYDACMSEQSSCDGLRCSPHTISVIIDG